MNKEYLDKIKQAQDHIRIYPENRMQIINHTMKPKWVHTAYKKISAAHLIDPVQMHRYIGCPVSVSKNQLSSVHPEKCEQHCSCQNPLQYITYYFSVKNSPCFSTGHRQFSSDSEDCFFYSHGSLEQFSEDFPIFFNQCFRGNTIHTTPDQYA